MSGDAAHDANPATPRCWVRLLAFAGLVLAFFMFAALGIWQVERLQWKLALIQRVNERVGAAPVDAPGPLTWPLFKPSENEYRHVRLAGRLLRDRSTLVAASTELGQGYWVLTPLCSEDGGIRLVNLGFIPTEAAKNSGNNAQAQPSPLCQVDSRDPSEPVVLDGLLRLSEPHGGFLRRNDPLQNRWYSRDVQAIATARGLARVAPYFVDADSDDVANPYSPPSGTLAHPVGGLTVVAFHNNHLVYAITWFALALMVAYAGIKIVYAKPRTNPHSE